MNIERFTLSLNLMKRVRDQKMPFSIQFWFMKYNEYMKIRPENGSIEHPCGYAACVAGHMALDPDHNALGFIKFGSEPLYRPTGNFNFHAIAEFWECDLEQAEYICDPYSYLQDPLIDEVINRMEKLMQDELETTNRPA